MTKLISPWDSILDTLIHITNGTGLDGHVVQLRAAIKAELESAYARGYTRGRATGYDEAAQERTPTRHEMGG